MMTRNTITRSKRFFYSLASALIFLALSLPLYAGQETNKLEIQSVVVGDQPLITPAQGSLNLGVSPKNISFRFGLDKPDSHSFLRLRCQLEGFENTWQAGDGFMFLAIRFFNTNGDQIDQENFPVWGDSAGWDGSLQSSPLTHRRETLIVPANAARAWVVISSAGPPPTVGIYVVANLVMMETTNNLVPKILAESPFDHATAADENVFPDWERDGTHMSMAKVVRIGQEPSIKAFAIEDEDPEAHAEWHNAKEIAPAVHPGNRLVVEWNEMYSIGEAKLNSAFYPNLPAGNYRFHVMGVDLMGKPDGEEASLNVFVLQPLWKRPWFWIVSMLLVLVAMFGIFRYVVWQRMQREMLHLRNQRAMEGERLRIARDIHDDLGARVTQISMISASTLQDSTLSTKTREELTQIKQMSRDLISALYETVWTVNPEYDDLDALGNYLCQMVNQLCKQTLFRCRLQVAELPKQIQVSSQIRHNIAMAVKEAVNNAVKHSQGSEIGLQLRLEDSMLKITVQDNGCGFQLEGCDPGHGLKNIKRRLEDIGGSCLIESNRPGGTSVHLNLLIHPDLAQASKTAEKA